jgi:hypothetical protein
LAVGVQVCHGIGQSLGRIIQVIVYFEGFKPDICSVNFVGRITGGHPYFTFFGDGQLVDLVGGKVLWQYNGAKFFCFKVKCKQVGSPQQVKFVLIMHYFAHPMPGQAIREVYRF